MIKIGHCKIDILEKPISEAGLIALDICFAVIIVGIRQGINPGIPLELHIPRHELPVMALFDFILTYPETCGITRVALARRGILHGFAEQSDKRHAGIRRLPPQLAGKGQRIVIIFQCVLELTQGI